MIFYLFSAVTIKFLTEPKSKRYRPQAGKVSIRFGGGSDFMSPFQEAAEQHQRELLLKKQALLTGALHAPGVTTRPPKQTTVKPKSNFGKW